VHLAKALSEAHIDMNAQAEIGKPGDFVVRRQESYKRASIDCNDDRLRERTDHWSIVCTYIQPGL